MHSADNREKKGQYLHELPIIEDYIMIYDAMNWREALELIREDIKHSKSDGVLKGVKSNIKPTFISHLDSVNFQVTITHKPDTISHQKVLESFMDIMFEYTGGGVEGRYDGSAEDSNHISREIRFK